MLSASKSGSGLATGYNLTRSLRTRASATPWLNRTFAAGNQKTWTLSTWVKRGTLGSGQVLLSTGVLSSSDSTYANISFNASDQLTFTAYTVVWRTTTQVFRDPSSWYHIVLAFDTTQATAANRVKLYVNGVQVTSFVTSGDPTLNTDYAVNQAAAHYFGYPASIYSYFDGYKAETYFINGLQLTPSSFGSYNALTGVWQPAPYTGAYSTNGFYLNFTDNSALTTSSNVGLGKDFSGNGNYWVTNNISITAGVTYDSMTDVPTLTSATAANYCVLSPLDVSTSNSQRPTDGNLTYPVSGAFQYSARGTIFVTSGKWYAEFTISASTAIVAVVNADAGLYGLSGTNGIYALTTQIFNNSGTAAQTGLAAFAASDVIGVAFDAGASTVQFYKNNTAYGTALTISGFAAPYAFQIGSNGGVCTINANFGQRPFTYTPPTGFVALNTYNLPTSTIVKGNTVMDATLYTGNGTSQSIVNAAGFKPDLFWAKRRNSTAFNALFDSVRGANSALYSNTTNAQDTSWTGQSFTSTGFTVDAAYSGETNANTGTFVGWQWQAGQGSSSSNTNGSITSTVSVNASAGFSVVTYTGNGVNGATVGHGLGVAPSLIIAKPRNAVNDWPVYHASVGNTAALLLDRTDAISTSALWFNNTSPTSSVFSLGTISALNGSGVNVVAYCWTPIAGYSAFGSYTGNGSADGPFVYTGFRPRWIMTKQSSGSGQSWNIFDTARNTYNLANTTLYADQSSAEDSVSNAYDILSNGFKLRTSASQGNTNGATYVYAAFAENPFKNVLAR